LFFDEWETGEVERAVLRWGEIKVRRLISIGEATAAAPVNAEREIGNSDA
jgi:hypothetical protein